MITDRQQVGSTEKQGIGVIYNNQTSYMTILSEIYLELLQLQSNKWLSPKEIRDVRKLYRLTQVNFAKLLHISYHTYKNWEIGHRVPSSPAMALLYIARDHQELFLKDRETMLSTISNL